MGRLSSGVPSAEHTIHNAYNWGKAATKYMQENGSSKPASRLL